MWCVQVSNDIRYHWYSGRAADALLEGQVSQIVMQAEGLSLSMCPALIHVAYAKVSGTC